MNIVESVSIYGFWGSEIVRVRFERDVNFLIGRNGSGKTTIINLIAAALKGDIATLYSVSFERIVVTLKSIGANKKPIIEVKKRKNSSSGALEVEYLIKGSTTEKGDTFLIEGPFEDRLYMDSRSIRHRRSVEIGSKLSSILGGIVEVNWVSVHRGSLNRFPPSRRDEEFDSAIDQKIDEISQKFASYFSLLASRAELEIKSFQEQVFLSLLDQERDFNSVFLQLNEEPQDKSVVIGVLLDLGVNSVRAHRAVSAHFAKVDAAKRKWEGEKQLPWGDAITLSDTIRVARMIKKWHELNQKRDDIFKPKSEFERIMNKMFGGKSLKFDQRNSPVIDIPGRPPIPIGALSSGEKQLFILLGEVLLQENRPVVFISDEPELSLHVDWQSQLFKNIVKLNPNCQVISATHSPDIVGFYQSKVIKVEDCLADVHANRAGN